MLLLPMIRGAVVDNIGILIVVSTAPPLLLLFFFFYLCFSCVNPCNVFAYIVGDDEDRSHPREAITVNQLLLCSCYS
jgi:hypothetical protein